MQGIIATDQLAQMFFASFKEDGQADNAHSFLTDFSFTAAWRLINSIPAAHTQFETI